MRRQVLVLLATVAACHRDPHLDQLNLPERPFAVGAELDVRFVWSNGSDRTMEMVSQDPGVMQVVSSVFEDNGFTVTLRAIAPGQTLLVANHEGDEVGDFEVAVATATRFDITDPALRDMDTAPDLGAEARVVTDDGAFLELRTYDAAGQRLVADTIYTTTPGDIDVTGMISGDAFLVTPATDGAHTVMVSAAGVTTRSLTVTGVPVTDVTTLQLEAPPVTDEDEGARVCLGLVARDASSRRIYGPRATWTVEGNALSEQGERLCYDFARDETPTVVATVGTATVTTMVNGVAFDPADEIGCSIGVRRGRLLLALPFVGALAIALALRRRRR